MAVFERLLLRKGLQRFPAHNDHFSLCHLTEDLLVPRDPHQQAVLITDRPIAVHSRWSDRVGECLRGKAG